MNTPHNEDNPFSPQDLPPITEGERAELKPYVEAYRAAVPEFVDLAIRAGAFDDCVDATRRLIPMLAQGGMEKLPAMAASMLVELAQSWRREGRAS